MVDVLTTAGRAEIGAIRVHGRVVWRLRSVLGSGSMRLHPLVAIPTIGAFFLGALAIVVLLLPEHPFAASLLRAVQILGFAALIAAALMATRNNGAKD
jgi:hypothetical protein